MFLSEFDYSLPREFIAQSPLNERDQSKLMMLNRSDRSVEHHQFFELPNLLEKDSVLVFNQSKVIPARLEFKMENGSAEIFLVKQVSEKIWECMVKPGRKFEEGTEILINKDLKAKVRHITSDGLRQIAFEAADLHAYLDAHGTMPTPPYIHETLKEPERYQTVYAKTDGSVAAPTAGLHFTDNTFRALAKKGIKTEFLTLHVGLGTFQGVKTDTIENHQMHSEWFELSPETAERLNKAKQEGKKIVAVGTTSIRVLESCARGGKLVAKSGETDIFIYPGYKWQFVDQLITNFHVPKSTLLMLVSAFADRTFILEAYEEAKKNNYRFFSFGDAMLIK